MLLSSEDREKKHRIHVAEVEPNDDAESQKAAVASFLRHKKEICADPDLQYLVSTYQMMEWLDEDLRYRRDKDMVLLTKDVFDTFLELNQVKSSFGDKPLLVLTKMMVAWYKQNHPGAEWNRSMAAESALATEAEKAGLTGQGGFWGVAMEIAEKTTTHGAKEIQKSVAQLLLEIAKLQEDHATETLPYVASPPDPSVRQRYATDGKEYRFRAGHHALDYQRSQNFGLGHLYEINTAKFEGMKYSPLFRFVDGEVRYFEYESIETMPIPVYRESASGEVEYTEIPANEFLTMNPWEIEQMYGFGMAQMPIKERKWTKLSGTPNLSEMAPALAVSLGGFTHSNSELIKFARSGRHMIHLHFNHADNTQEIFFGHGSIDGMDGIGLSLAVAETIGATEDSKTGLQIEWNPPTQDGKIVDKTQLNRLIDLIRINSNPDKYLDVEGLTSVIFGLELSDISISEEFTREEFETMQKLVDKINEKWFDPVSAKLKKMVEGELTGKALGHFLYRLANSKMTVAKYLDLMTRQYFGPSATCIVPRVVEQRLSLIEFGAMEEGMRQMVMTSPEREGEKVFGVGPEVAEKELQRLFNLMRKEFSRAWLTASDLSLMKETVADFRGRTEFVGFLLNGGAYEASQKELQTSNGGVAEKPRREGRKQADVRNSPKIMKFVSAHTAGVLEGRFGRGLSWLSKMRVEKIGDEEKVYETMRYNDRVRLNSRTLERLRMGSPDVMEPIVQEVAEVLGRGDRKKTEEILKEARLAMKECFEARIQEYDLEAPNYLRSNILLVLRVLEKYRQSHSWFWGDSPKKDEEYAQVVRGLQYLTIAGLIDQQRGFKKTCVAGAKELLEAIK